MTEKRSKIRKEGRTRDRDMNNKMPKYESERNAKPSDYTEPNKSIKQKI